MKSLSSILTAVVAIVAATLSPAVSAEKAANPHSQIDAPGIPGRIAELEKAFWVCDHAGTTQGVDMHLAATCASITDELKRVKFGQDFEKLVDWWRLNKAAEHRALDRASNAQTNKERDSAVRPAGSI